MYLALCLHQKISNTCELQDDPIIRGYHSLVNYFLIYFSRCRTCRCSIFVHLCHIHRYVYASVLWVTRDQKLNRGGMLYRVAQNKWDQLLKLCMGYFLTIKIKIIIMASKKHCICPVEKTFRTFFENREGDIFFNKLATIYLCYLKL